MVVIVSGHTATNGVCVPNQLIRRVSSVNNVQTMAITVVTVTAIRRWWLLLSG